MLYLKPSETVLYLKTQSEFARRNTNKLSEIDYFRFKIILNRINSFYDIRAVYDLKKQEIVNKDKIKWEVKDYKIIRMD